MAGYGFRITTEAVQDPVACADRVGHRFLRCKRLGRYDEQGLGRI